MKILTPSLYDGDAVSTLYQDPPARQDQGLKKRETSKDAEPSKKPTSAGSSKGDDMGNTDEKPNVEAVTKDDWFKKPARPPTPDLEWNTRKSVDDGSKQSWLNDLANVEKPPLTFDDLMSTPIDFFAFAMNRLKISKLTKADLVRLVYNLLKGTCKSCVELKYNIKECYQGLSDQLYWNNPEANSCPYDLSKPLPLHKSLGRLIVPTDFFFHNDLEYMKTGSTDKKYTTSKTKTKTAKDLSLGTQTSTVLQIRDQHGEIVVQRAGQKLYKFMKGDFPRLHLSDIEDMLLLVKRVEDLQLGVESYLKRKRLMRTDKLYKFSDGTLTSIRNTLDQMLRNL
ncbi:hypothetical protein Tco_0589056, partial [Tanacetum coccineum]